MCLTPLNIFTLYGKVELHFEGSKLYLPRSDYVRIVRNYSSTKYLPQSDILFMYKWSNIDKVLSLVPKYQTMVETPAMKHSSLLFQIQHFYHSLIYSIHLSEASLLKSLPTQIRLCQKCLQLQMLQLIHRMAFLAQSDYSLHLCGASLLKF